MASFVSAEFEFPTLESFLRIEKNKSDYFILRKMPRDTLADVIRE